MNDLGPTLAMLHVILAFHQLTLFKPFKTSVRSCRFQFSRSTTQRSPSRLNQTPVKFDDNRWPHKYVPNYEFLLSGHVKRLSQQKVRTHVTLDVAKKESETKMKVSFISTSNKFIRLKLSKPVLICLQIKTANLALK